ncbi:MAG: hypothetical protein AAB225_01730 [Acidobacteriota bacterium]
MLFRVQQFLHYVVPAVVRPARIVWNQVIGFVFLVLAFAGALRLVYSLRHFDGSPRSFMEVAITGLFTLVMGGFGVSSFWHARKISRA